MLCLQDHEAQVLWFGGMKGLHSFTYGVLKIPSLICASTSVLKLQLLWLVCFLVQFCPLFDDIFISSLVILWLLDLEQIATESFSAQTY